MATTPTATAPGWSAHAATTPAPTRPPSAALTPPSATTRPASWRSPACRPAPPATSGDPRQLRLPQLRPRRAAGEQLTAGQRRPLGHRCDAAVERAERPGADHGGLLGSGLGPHPDQRAQPAGAL